MLNPSDPHDPCPDKAGPGRRYVTVFLGAFRVPSLSGFGDAAASGWWNSHGVETGAAAELWYWVSVVPLATAG